MSKTNWKTELHCWLAAAVVMAVGEATYWLTGLPLERSPDLAFFFGVTVVCAFVVGLLTHVGSG